jgi:hypothetical protein
MTQGCPTPLALFLALCGVSACGAESIPRPPSDDPPEEEEVDAAVRGGAGGRGGTTGSPDARAATGGNGGAAPDAGGRGGSGGGSAGASGGDAGRDSGSGGGDASSGAGGSGGGSNFSFFVTSLPAMRRVSGSQNGFGGDLRFGEATGLAGADKICRTIAETALPGSGAKTWRAFLSASTGAPGGGPVHAIDRVGEGPWYDRMGRLFAMNKAGLIAGPRPMGSPQVVNDFPNEDGIPNKQGTDNHDTLTGSNRMGRYAGTDAATCKDWTSSVPTDGRPQIGHSWPRSMSNLSFGGQWIADHTAPGCGAGVNTSTSMGGSFGRTVGASGGYGGIYCFAVNE